MTSLMEDNFSVLVRELNYYWKLTVCKESKDINECRFHVSLINTMYRNEKTRYFQVLLAYPEIYHRKTYSYLNSSNLADLIKILSGPCDIDTDKTLWEVLVEQYCKFNDIEEVPEIEMPDYRLLEKGAM